MAALNANALAVWVDLWKYMRSLVLADSRARRLRHVYGFRGFVRQPPPIVIDEQKVRVLRRRHQFARWRNLAQFRRMLQLADERAVVGRRVHGIRALRDSMKQAPHTLTDHERQKLRRLRKWGYFMHWCASTFAAPPPSPLGPHSCRPLSCTPSTTVTTHKQ